jgi:hypothetical protein
MFRVRFEQVYILWIATPHRWRMTWWQFSNHALYLGLKHKFPLEPCVPVVCCSAVRGSLSGLFLIVNTEIRALSIEGRSFITQRLLHGRLFHDEFAWYAPFVVCRRFG